MPSNLYRYPKTMNGVKIAYWTIMWNDFCNTQDLSWSKLKVKGNNIEKYECNINHAIEIIPYQENV